MTPPSALAAAAITTVAAAAATAWSLRRVASATLVGDEYEYAAVATATPGPAPFRRMPGYPWLLRRCGTLGRARAAGALGSIAATGAATVSAVHLAGGWPGLLAGIWMAVAAERVLLSARLWPDSLAAAGHAVLVAACLPGTAVHWSAAAVACAALVLLRIDGAATTACVAVALWRTPWAAAAVGAAGAAALVLASARRRVNGLAGPVDTTAWFNVRLAAERLRDGRLPLEPDVARLAGTWAGEGDDQRAGEARAALSTLARHPVLWGRQVLRRATVLLGPDTFGRHRLLPSYDPRPTSALTVSLRVAVPALVVLAAAGVASGAAPALALYCGLQLLVLALFHARTRFRAVLLPGFAALAAAGLEGLQSHPTMAVVGAACGLVLTTLGAITDLERAGLPVRDVAQKV